MANPYRIGYAFEYRIRKFLEKNNYFIIRSGKSRFPDGVALSVDSFVADLPAKFLFECKKNKYLSKEEKEEAKQIIQKTGMKFFVFWNNKRKIDWYSFN